MKMTKCKGVLNGRVSHAEACSLQQSCSVTSHMFNAEMVEFSQGGKSHCFANDAMVL